MPPSHTPLPADLEEGELLAESGDDAERRISFSWQGVGIALLIYVPARIFSAAAMLWTSRFQVATDYALYPRDTPSYYFLWKESPAHPSYLQMVTNWDGQWYGWIATSGYLRPTEDASSVAAWAWAFPPGYPFLVRGVSALSGWSFEASAAVTSTVLGALAMVVLFELLRSSGGRWLGIVGVATTSFFISSPLLQFAYSESLALLLLVCTLLLAQRGRWLTATVLVVALSFTRLVSPPLAVVAAVMVLGRWRRGERPSRGELVRTSVFAATAVVGPLLWGLMARELLDVSTSGAARAAGQLSNASFGWFGALYRASPFLVLLPILVAVLLVRVMTDPRTKRWGEGVRVWAWSYPLYILAVTGLSTGLFRYLLLAFPLGLPLAGSAEHPSRRRVLLVIMFCALLMAGQVVWLRYSWTLTPDAVVP